MIHTFYRRSFLALFSAAVILFGCPAILARETRVVIENNGWKLIGDLNIPKSKAIVPAVILLNKANGTRQAYAELAKHLAERNIASLRIDLRGHGESINKGKFGAPFDEKMLALIAGSDSDIVAAFEFLKKLKQVDAKRIGAVGASYSGEEMAVAARKVGYGKAYVALSPGSFSDLSLSAIDSSAASWLFVTSAEERFLQGFLADVRKKSKTAQTIEYAGDKHATDLLQSNPELAEMIAVWFAYRL